MACRSPLSFLSKTCSLRAETPVGFVPARFLRRLEVSCPPIPCDEMDPLSKIPVGKVRTQHEIQRLVMATAMKPFEDHLLQHPALHGGNRECRKAILAGVRLEQAPTDGEVR